MKSSSKIVLICSGIAAAGAAIYWFIVKPNMKPPTVKRTDPNTGKTTVVQPPSPSEVYKAPPASSFPLHKGSKGADVVAWQQLLAKKDAEYAKVDPAMLYDGDFGSRTEAATMRVLGKTSVEKADMSTVAASIGEAVKISDEAKKVNDLWNQAAANYPKGKGFVLAGEKSLEYYLPYVSVNPITQAWTYTGTKDKFNGGTAFTIAGIWVRKDDMGVWILGYAKKGIVIIPANQGYVKY